jgi:hypothetical protein
MTDGSATILGRTVSVIDIVRNPFASPSLDAPSETLRSLPAEYGAHLPHHRRV